MRANKNMWIIFTFLLPVLAIAQGARKARQQAERQTENMIYERLESSRLSDEKKRAERLFGESSPRKRKMISTPSVVYIKPAPAPKKTVLKPKVEVKSLPEAEITGESSVIFKKSKPISRRYYIGANTGVSEFKQVSNLENEYSVGITLGSIFESDLIVEWGFAYSQYYIDTFLMSGGDIVYTDLDQYNLSLAAKYAPLFDKVSPQVGAILSYTRREYNGTLNALDSVTDDRHQKSGAFDVGLTAGLDFELSEEFILGGEFKYLWNLTHSDKDRVNTVFEDKSPEESDYYNFSITAKFVF